MLKFCKEAAWLVIKLMWYLYPSKTIWLKLKKMRCVKICTINSVLDELWGSFGSGFCFVYKYYNWMT